MLLILVYLLRLYPLVKHKKSPGENRGFFFRSRCHQQKMVSPEFRYDKFCRAGTFFLPGLSFEIALPNIMTKNI